MHGDFTPPLTSSDGNRDILDCGPGVDTANINRNDGDVVINCEVVNVE